MNAPDPYSHNAAALDAVIDGPTGILDPDDVARDIYASLVGSLLASTDPKEFREMLRRAAGHAGLVEGHPSGH